MLLRNRVQAQPRQHSYAYHEGRGVTHKRIFLSSVGREEGRCKRGPAIASAVAWLWLDKWLWRGKWRTRRCFALAWQVEDGLPRQSASRDGGRMVSCGEDGGWRFEDGCANRVTARSLNNRLMRLSKAGISTGFGSKSGLLRFLAPFCGQAAFRASILQTPSSILAFRLWLLFKSRSP